MGSGGINKIKAVLLLVVCVGAASFYPPALLAEEHPWQLRINKDGVTVHTRKVEGSSTLAFKGSIIVDAPLSKVAAVFEDVATTRRWFYQCVASELVENENSQQQVVHIMLNLPWPASERDCVFRIKRIVDAVAGGVSYTVEAIPDRLPRRKGVVRVPYLKASWHFAALPDGTTSVDFQQHSDPGGYIPRFLSNSMVVDMPFHSLKDLRAIILATPTHK